MMGIKMFHKLATDQSQSLFGELLLEGSDHTNRAWSCLLVSRGKKLGAWWREIRQIDLKNTNRAQGV